MEEGELKQQQSPIEEKVPIISLEIMCFRLPLLRVFCKLQRLVTRLLSLLDDVSKLETKRCGNNGSSASRSELRSLRALLDIERCVHLIQILLTVVGRDRPVTCDARKAIEAWKKFKSEKKIASQKTESLENVIGKGDAQNLPSTKSGSLMPLRVIRKFVDGIYLRGEIWGTRTAGPPTSESSKEIHDDYCRRLVSQFYTNILPTWAMDHNWRRQRQASKQSNEDHTVEIFAPSPSVQYMARFIASTGEYHLIPCMISGIVAFAVSLGASRAMMRQLDVDLSSLVFGLGHAIATIFNRGIPIDQSLRTSLKSQYLRLVILLGLRSAPSLQISALCQVLAKCSDETLNKVGTEGKNQLSNYKKKFCEQDSKVVKNIAALRICHLFELRTKRRLVMAGIESSAHQEDKHNGTSFSGKPEILEPGAPI
eukprot:jgi/Bigna1/126916/aug1.3_g1624